MPETPQQEVVERIAESSPAWGLPFYLGLENARHALAAARRRVNDSHRAQTHALGQTIGMTDLEPSTEEEEMGGISVAGDTTINVTLPDTKPKTDSIPLAQSATTAAQSIPASIGSKLLPLALATVLGGGAGAAIPLALSVFNKPPVVTQPQANPDYQLGLQVKDTP